MALAAIVFCQIGVVECARTQEQSVFKTGLFSNRNIIRGIVFEILLISAIMYVPFMQGIFQTTSIGLRDWLFLILCPVPIVVIDEFRKSALRRAHKKIRK